VTGRAGIAAALAVAASATACLSFHPPTVAFAGVAVSDVSREKATLGVDLDVENPNGYRLGVQSLRYRLSVDGTPAGEGSLDSAVSVPAHGRATVRLPLTLDWAPLKSRALGLALSGGIDWAVEGDVVFTTPLGSRTRPFRHEDRLSLFR
jgi:LEA14-like dessication related protein